MNEQGLSGRVIAITRPREQAHTLAEGVRVCGGVPLLCPLLEISAASNPEPLHAAAAALARYALAVFVSPNAVRHAVPTLLAQAPWPAATRAAVVGEGTANALQQAGGPLPLCPSERFDSEGLLALPELAASRIAGQSVALFRGNGGRELLAQTLRERGATVDEIPCYQRHGPTPETRVILEHALKTGRIDALTLSSSEALQHLLTCAHSENMRAKLLRLPLLTSHPRIAENARAVGFLRVVAAEATDVGLLASLCAYNWEL